MPDWNDRNNRLAIVRYMRWNDSRADALIIPDDFEDLLHNSAGGIMPNIDGSSGDPRTNQQVALPPPPPPAPPPAPTITQPEIRRPIGKIAVDLKPLFEDWLKQEVPKFALANDVEGFRREMQLWADRGIPSSRVFDAKEIWDETLRVDAEEKRAQWARDVQLKLESARALALRLQGNLVQVEQNAAEIEKQKNAEIERLKGVYDELQKTKQEKIKTQQVLNAKSVELDTLKATFENKNVELVRLHNLLKLAEDQDKVDASVIAKLRNDIATKTKQQESRIQAIQQTNVELEKARENARTAIEQVKDLTVKTRELQAQNQQTQTELEASQQEVIRLSGVEQEASRLKEENAKFQKQVEENKKQLRVFIQNVIVPEFAERIAIGGDVAQLRAEFWKHFDLRHWNNAEVETLWASAQNQSAQVAGDTPANNKGIAALVLGVLYLLGGA